MKFKLFAATLGLLVAALSPAAGAPTPAANHLIISEVGVYARSGYSNAPDSAEYTEIYNPTSAAIPLDNYYLSDYNRYFDLPSIMASQTSNVMGTSDFMLQFPPGSSIPAGGILVVTCNGTSFTEAYMQHDINNFHNLPGSPQLFEIYNSDPSIPDMINYNPYADNYAAPPMAGDPTTPDPKGTNMSHTDAGESTVLFYWDINGTTSLVKDVDIVEWHPIDTVWDPGSGDLFVNKGGQAELGPTQPLESYVGDAGSPETLDVGYLSGHVGHLERRSILQVGEVGTTGNGLDGTDQSMELGDLNWTMMRGEPMNSSPGMVSFGPASQNQAPVIGHAQRDIQYPTPGQTVHITAPVYDDGSFTAYLLVNTGSGFTTTTMTAEGASSPNMYGANINTSGLAAKTHIKYYVAAIDSGGLMRTESDYQELETTFPGYHVFMVDSTSTPYSSSDIVINEIMMDPDGYDNYTHSQYVELYNPGSTDINLGSYVYTTDYWSPNGVVDPINHLQIPEGTILKAGGYLVIAGNKAVFDAAYPGIDSTKVIDCNVVPKSAMMAHAGSTIYLLGPDELDYNSTPVPLTNAFKSLTYDDDSPWPLAHPQNTGASNTGYSIELTTVSPDSDANGSNWALSTLINGSPLKANPTNTTMVPGGVFVTSLTRDVQNPTPSDTINITATVGSANPVAGAKIYVNTGSGFDAGTSMTTSDNQTFNAAIGPFPDQTLVKYYVEAVDNQGHTGTSPALAPDGGAISMIVDPTPVTPSDLIINEIMFDPLGGDNSTNPEYVELYNARSTPLNVSGYMYDTSTNFSIGRFIPDGTIMKPHGYLVLACRKDFLVSIYHSPFPGFYHTIAPSVDPDIVVNNGWQPSSYMANSGTRHFYIVTTNAVNWNGTNVPFNDVPYQITSPWPEPPAGATALNGPSIELKDPSLDVTNGGNWLECGSYYGTPGLRNAVTPPPASVSNWTMY